MVKYNVEIEGISDLKMDNWVDGQQPKNDDGYKKQAELKVYRNAKGDISIPATAIKACMKFASSEIGKRTDAKKNRQTILSTVFIESDMISLGKKEHDGIIRDIVSRGQGAKVTRVPTYRPLIKKGWKANFEISSFGIPKEFIKECLELGGLRFGLLSHRPEYGRYQLNKFIELKK